MFLLRTGLALLLELALAAAALAHGGVRHDFRIVNARWFDGRTFVRKTMFTVGGSFRSSWEGPVEATIDLHGGYVIPPFADAHNHAFGADARVAEELKAYLTAGVFYVKNPNDIAALSAPVAARLNKPATIDIVYAHGGLTAPGGQPVPIYDSAAGQGVFRDWPKERMPGQAYYLVGDAAALDSAWPLLLATKPDFVKTYLEHSEEWERRRNDPAFFGARGLDPSLLPKIVARAHFSGLRVSTHVATSADFRNALSAGVDEINHLPLESLTDEDAKRAAASRTVIVTTTLSHRKTDGIRDLDGIHRENLKRLRKAGAVLALGLDNHGTVVAEAENIHRLAPFDDAALLDIWTAATARAILPERKIGCLSDGCEASFLALAGDPLGDFANVRKIAFRMKQGFVLEVVPSVADPIRQVVRDRGADAAAAEYRRLRAEKPEGYDFAEPELNRLGYELLRAGNPKDAAAIFRLNTGAYPRSPNAQDSLLEACRAAGDRACSDGAARALLELLKTDTVLAPEFKRTLEQNARKQLQEPAPN
jgi:cytosine/adenosine deaminase-related metal-dependent hydrolase